MKLGLFGSGNAAAATAIALARNNPFEDIVWVARTPEKATVALRDVASAFPDFIAKVRIKPSFEGERLDVIAVLAGSQIPAGGKARDGLKDNVGLVDAYISEHVKPETVVVLLGSPVDEVTENVAARLDLPSNQIIGFGGDLDVRRLSVVLAEKKIQASPVHIVGEHGARAIPVYDGEELFDEVASGVRNMFKTLTHLSGPPRNLATGALMSELLASLTRAIPTLHHVTSHNPSHKAFLTWPSLIAKGGISTLVDIKLGHQAQMALDVLVQSKMVSQ
ncbi:MAG: hypothetical protein P4M13_11045 [Alphaproteobacteria bacterium]|nr:hypothetical protein [Alphaproteobacteria bacterium]